MYFTGTFDKSWMRLLTASLSFVSSLITILSLFKILSEILQISHTVQTVQLGGIWLNVLKQVTYLLVRTINESLFLRLSRDLLQFVSTCKHYTQ